MTRAPAWVSARTMAAPRPLVAPVKRTRVPFNGVKGPRMLVSLEAMAVWSLKDKRPTAQMGS